MKPSKHLHAVLAAIVTIVLACAGAQGLDASSPLQAEHSEGSQWEEEKLAEAKALIYDGRYSEGTAVLEELLSRRPDSRDALYLLGTAYEWQDKLEEAERAYRTIVSVDEGDLDAWCQVAKLQAWRGRYDDAILLYGRLISGFGDRSDLLVGLARTLSWANRLEEALQHYERVILQEPDNVEALAGKAQVLRWMGDVRLARVVIRKAQSTDPRHPEVEREAKQIELELRPRVTISYSESLEKDYLRSTGEYYYNLGNSKWLAEADFFLEHVDKLSLDFWSAHDWEIDKTLGHENFRLASKGFAASASLPLGHPASIGARVSVTAYDKYRENVLYPIMADEVRKENYEVWASARRGAWDFSATIASFPLFEKKERTLPPLNKLEVGEQTVGRVEVGHRLSKTVRASLGCEAGRYSDDNERIRVYGAVDGSPSRAAWVYLRYAAHYEDFESASRNYFTPLEAFKHGADVVAKRARPKSYLSVGLTLGHLHSRNFGDIFSVGLSGTASKNVTGRWRLLATGLVARDDNKYSVSSVRLGFELIL